MPMRPSLGVTLKYGKYDNRQGPAASCAASGVAIRDSAKIRRRAGRIVFLRCGRRCGAPRSRIQCREFLEPGTALVSDRVATTGERGTAVLALLVHGVEVEPEVGPAIRTQETWRGLLDHTLQRREAGILGVHPLAHELHRQESTAHHDVALATAGRACGTDVVVGVLTRTDDR